MLNVKRFKKDKKKHMKQLLPQIAEVEQQVQGKGAWSRDTFTAMLENEHNHLLMMRTDEESKPVVAYCLYQVMFESAEILRMGTHPKWQRQGIAQSLLARLFQELTELEVESLMLEVRANNKPAIKLYEKNGFEQIDIRKGYYSQEKGPAIDALIMKKDL